MSGQSLSENSCGSFEGNRQAAEAFLENLIKTGRNPVEVLIKAIALRVACVIAVGHLTSLQKRSRSSQVKDVILFILFPTIPLARILLRISDSVWRALHRNRHGRPSNNNYRWSYWICACCGMEMVREGYAVNNNTVAPLDSIDPDDAALIRVSEKRGVLQYARLFVILTFIIQVSLTLVQWGRRIQFSSCHGSLSGHYMLTEPQLADSFIDQGNALVAFGALFAALSSLLIEAGNYTWRYTGPEFVYDNTLFTCSPRHLSVALLLQNAVLYRVFRFWCWAALRMMWHDIVHGDSIRFAFAACLCLICLGVTLFSILGLCIVGALQLLPLSLPTYLSLSDSGPDHLVQVFVQVSLVIPAFMLLYAITEWCSFFDCHRNGLSGCYNPLYLWKDTQLDYYWTF